MPIPKDLDDGIFGAVVMMHRRDFIAAHYAARTYLGRDTLVEQMAAELKALPHEQQQYYKATGLGRFGICHMMNQPEVTLALKVVAREMDPHFRLTDDFKSALSNPAKVQKVMERFPAITPERIANILA